MCKTKFFPHPIHQKPEIIHSARKKPESIAAPSVASPPMLEPLDDAVPLEAYFVWARRLIAISRTLLASPVLG